MATIQIILDAINNASRTFDEVAGSLETVRVAQDQAAESAVALSDAQLEAANTAVAAFSAYSELRASADELAVANVNAAMAAGQLATATQRSADQAVTSATAYSRLTDAQLNAAQAGMEAAAAERTEAEALAGVTRDAALAAAGIRVLSDAELAAAGNATRTALAIRVLTAAELEAANTAVYAAEMDALAEAASVRVAEQARARAAAEVEAAAAARTAAIADGAAAIAAADLARAADEGAAAADRAGAAANNAYRGFGAWGLAMRGLTATISLWGGLLDGLLPRFLTQVAGWHLILDAVIEFIAVWGPAAVAVTAWGVAASDAINDVIRHMTNLHTVSDAYQQSIPPMTDDLEKLHDAVRPQVYSIFGDALSVITKRGGELNKVIMQTGVVFQQLAARTALAINGASFSEFIGKSVQDVRLLGTAFGNLFGIIGNLIRMNQGWATVLLEVGTAILGLIERVTSLIIPLGQLLVLGHGFVLWVGLAVTAAVRFGATLIGWGAALVGAVVDLFSLAGALSAYIAQVGLAAAATEAFAAVNPFVWVGIAVAALAGMTYAIATSKSQIQQWGDTLQKTETDAATLSQGVGLLASGVTESTDRLSQAQSKLADTQNSIIQVNLHTGQAVGTVSNAYAEQEQKVRDLTGVQKQQAADQQTYNTRLGDLAKTYGGVSNAQGLLISSGVTMKQMLDTSGAAWAMIKQQVDAAYRGYQAMGTQQGVLGNDMQVLDKQATDQYAAMQKLNQAWDTQTSAMTGTQLAFDTAGQGFETLANNNQAVTIALGKLKEKFTEVKAGIDQLTPAGEALNQAFSTQVGNINSLADSWRSAGISQADFKDGIAAGIAPMEKYAQGSQEATAQLVGLAEEAGYQGPVSLKALNSYLGITSSQLSDTAGNMTTLKNTANQATAQEALLTSAMQAQGNYISSQLIGDITQAILKYNGVQAAAKAYGNAVAQYGAQSAEAKTKQDALTDSIIKAGMASNDSTKQIAAMIAKVLQIPESVALKIVMDGEGKFSIQQALNTGQSVKGITQGAPPGVNFNTTAKGWMVSGGKPGKDSVPILAMAGELMVPKPMVDAGEVDHLRGRIPGFAAGGMIGGSGKLYAAGDTQVLTGQRAVTDDTTFNKTFEGAFIRAMQGAMVTAEKGAASAAASAGGGGGQGPAPNTPAGNVRAVLQSLAAARGWTGAEWTALNAVEMREAGYNLNAQNPSSKAYGIAQFINGASEYAQYGGNSNTASGQATAMLNYIAQRYGDPIAAEAHEQNFGWYDNGGLLPPGLSLALNQSGSNEMVLPNGIIQGFTGGMQQLHPFFINLTSAVAKLTDATSKAATASAAVAAVVKPSAPLGKPAPKPGTIGADQKKIADDKANAGRLEARVKAVEQAIKDTPKSDKAALKEENALLKTLESALKKQNTGTGKDEAALAKEIVKENKATAAQMQKAIAAITKLLGSGSAATSKSNALWTTLVADEKKLAAAQAAIAGQMSGKSGGSSKITATLDKSSLSGFQAAEEKSFNAAVANLKAALAHPGSTPVKQIEGDLATLMKRQAAEEAQYAKASADATAKNMSHLMALVHDELATSKDKGLSKLPGTGADFKALQAVLTKLADAAEAAAKAAGKAAGGSSGGGTVKGTSPGSASYVTGTVTDKKTESELQQLLAVAKQELAEMKTMVTALAKIQAEAAPAAQAKAIGPAVADAIQSTARGAAGKNTTRKG